MTRWLPWLTSFSCWLLAGCMTAGQNPGCDDLEALQESVFRYQFEHNASAAQQNAAVYFLSLGKRGDPAPALMARFEGHRPVVKPASASSLAEGGLVIDTVTGERGLIFRIDAEEWGENQALVRGGYYEGEVSASGNVYTVKCQDGVWTVSDEVMRWIS